MYVYVYMYLYICVLCMCICEHCPLINPLLTRSFFFGITFRQMSRFSHVPLESGRDCVILDTLLLFVKYLSTQCLFIFFDPCFSFSLPDSRDATVDTSEEVPLTTNRLYRQDVINIRRVFPHKFEPDTRSGNLSHSQSRSAAFVINSSLQILDQTWLAVPPADVVSGVEGDWSAYKDSFPSHRFGNTVMPKEAREEHGDPPFQFTFKYTDTRTQLFFESDPWLKGGKIKLPGCFESGSTYGGYHVNKVALLEGLGKKALQTAHGCFDLNSDMNIILGELLNRDASSVDWNDLLSQFRILLDFNLKALRRTIMYTSSSVMAAKHMARELVLAKFAGKVLLKEACLVSDFGTPDLFGPLCADMAENVKMYRAHDTKEWLLTTRSATSGKRRNSSLLAPAAKKVKAAASPLSVPILTSPAATQGPKKSLGRGNFIKAGGKSGKKGRKGRGGKGS